MMIFNRLVGSLQVVAGGFVTGAFAWPVVAGWFLWRLGHPEARGGRVLAYLWASTALLLGLAGYLLVWPWL